MLFVVIYVDFYQAVTVMFIRWLETTCGTLTPRRSFWLGPILTAGCLFGGMAQSHYGSPCRNWEKRFSCTTGLVSTHIVNLNWRCLHVHSKFCILQTAKQVDCLCFRPVILLALSSSSDKTDRHLFNPYNYLPRSCNGLYCTLVDHKGFCFFNHKSFSSA